MSVKSKKFLTILSLFLPFFYYLFLLFSGGFENSYFFFLYNSLVIFSLPFLTSRYIFVKSGFSINGGFLFLIYPVTYFFLFLFSRILPFELSNALYFFSIIFVLKWNFFIGFLVWRLIWSKTRRFFSENVPLVGAFLLYIFVFFFTRNLDTIISLDYLQHISVSEKMKVGEQLCLTPNQCSELFLKLGYTTIYHTILGFLTTFSNGNVLRSMFFMDLAYPLFVCAIVFNFLKKFSKNIAAMVLFSLAAVLIYVNGSYETNLFLPQTLAFVIFLCILLEKKTQVSSLIGGGILLVLTHFVMGPYLFFFLLLKYFLLEKLPKKILSEFSKYIFFFALFTPVIFLLINSSGFSIESAFQQSDIDIIGGFTNAPFPQNMWNYFLMWGGVGVFLIFSILFQKQKKSPWYIYSLIYMSLTLCFYLLAPTYANKFLIGSSIFSVILMFKYLKNLNLKEPVIKVLISLILVCALFPNFVFRYELNLDFYKQNDGIATAVPQVNRKMLKHLKSLEQQNCIFVSDPMTQIQIEGLSNKNTARAQYLLPESRRSIFDFASFSDLESYKNLRDIKELKRRDMCFVYSSVIHTTVQRNDTNWLFHMFSVPKDNSMPVQETDVKYFMTDRGYEVTYQDPYFIVFIKNQK